MNLHCPDCLASRDLHRGKLGVAIVVCLLIGFIIGITCGVLMSA